MTHSNKSADDLPFLEDGVFRDRGAVNTRLETFVDAAFAFTLTLLVISFDSVPTTFDELTYALRLTPAFLASFALLMMFWFAHRSWSRRYGLDGAAAALISMALVFILLVYVFPLRSIASAALARMTGGWVPLELKITEEGQARGLFVIYAVGFMLASYCMAALYYYAYRVRDMLRLSDAESFLTRMDVYSWIIIGSTGIVSMVLAVVLPGQWLGLAGWSYALLGIIMPLFGAWISRQLRTRFGRD
ncbi:MAG: TMEM175 family protein [Pseudomonadota bacterium]